MDAENRRFVRHVISLSLEFDIQANIDVEIAFVVFAVGQAPESIYPDETEDVGNTRTHLYIGYFGDAFPVGDIEQLEGGIHAVGVRQAAPGHTDGKYLPQIQLLYAGNLPQEEAVEVVFIKAREPAVRDELVIVHAGEGVAVQEEGLVAFVQLEHREGDAAPDGTAFHVQVAETDGRGGNIPMQDGRRFDKVEVVFGDSLDTGGEIQREGRILGIQIGLGEEIAVYTLVRGRETEC